MACSLQVFLVSRNVFKRGDFCLFLASKIYDKIWHCFNIFCKFCVSENFGMSPVTSAQQRSCYKLHSAPCSFVSPFWLHSIRACHESGLTCRYLQVNLWETCRFFGSRAHNYTHTDHLYSDCIWQSYLFWWRLQCTGHKTAWFNTGALFAVQQTAVMAVIQVYEFLLFPRGIQEVWVLSWGLKINII